MWDKQIASSERYKIIFTCIRYTFLSVSLSFWKDFWIIFKVALFSIDDIVSNSLDSLDAICYVFKYYFVFLLSQFLHNVHFIGFFERTASFNSLWRLFRGFKIDNPYSFFLSDFQSIHAHFLLFFIWEWWNHCKSLTSQTQSQSYCLLFVIYCLS